MNSIALWALRAVLLVAASLKLREAGALSGTLGVAIAVVEVCAVVLTFWPSRFRSLAVVAVLWGFLGAGVVSAISILLDPSLGRSPCGCLGSMIDLRRDQALVLQGLVVVLASVAAIGHQPHATR